MHLTSVDLPAPLSPTSAVTSPACAVKSTSRRTCTGPKLLLMPRSSSRGAALAVTVPPSSPRWVTPVPAPGIRRGTGTGIFPLSADAGSGALGGVGAGAQVSLCHVAVGHDVLDVVLVDRDRRLQFGLDLLLAGGVVDAAVDARVLPLGQRDGQRGGGVGLLLDRLVDGHALVTVEDVLQALDGRVLPGHRYLAVEAVLLQYRDHRVGHAVVGDEHTLDVLVGGQHLLEDRAGLGVVPVRYRLVRALDERAVGVLRVEHRVVPLREERGVVVGRRSVQL